MGHDSSSRKPSLTAQQQAAITTRGVSVALSAGAGCGKTFVLTRRFLSHLGPETERPGVSHLVAITFTERAAREMRDRIRRECSVRLQSCEAAEVNYWLGIHRDLDSARITTIHSFCAALLRAHAVDARLDPQFALLDETTGGSFLRQTVEEALHDLLARQDPDCMELVYQLGLHSTRSILGMLVLNRFRIEFDFWRPFTPEQLAEHWQTIWRTHGFPITVQELAESEAVQTTLFLLRQHESSNAVMQERRRTLLALLPSLQADARSPEQFAETFEEIVAAAKVFGGGTAKSWSDALVYEQVKLALENLRKECAKTAKLLDLENQDTLPAARLGLHALQVSQKVCEVYERRKADAGVLDFDDLLLRTRNLLRDSPEVRRRAAASISLLMVDEFQDTDPVQAEIVRSLCGDELLSGKLFLVGDAKQSIYRFRRAEPQVFHDLRNSFPVEGQLPLSQNFRSQPEILNFVNCLFDGALSHGYEPLTPSFEQISPLPAIEFLLAVSDAQSQEESDNTAADRRRIEADWIARRIHQLLHDQVPRIRTRNPTTGEAELRCARQSDIVILLRAMSDVRYYEEALRNCDLEYYVVGGKAFYAQQEVHDLVNLCQCLDDVDNEISLVGVLRSPFFSLSDDSLLAVSTIGWSLADSLDCIVRDAQTDNAIAAKTAITENITDEANSGDEANTADAEPYCRTPPRQALSPLSETQREQVLRAARILDELRARKDTLPIAQLLTLAIARTGYDAALLAEFLGARKLANLRKLIDMARQFDRTGLFTLADFVDRLQDAVGDEAKESLAATHPESSNVIRLMTIHQSKGLEFPIVFVADMDRQSNNSTPQALFDTLLGPLVSVPEKFGDKAEHLGKALFRLLEKPQSYEEILRLLYVATTRAADYLVLSANMTSLDKPRHPWTALLARRFDLIEGVPRINPVTDLPEIPNAETACIPQIRTTLSRPEIELETTREARQLPLRDFRSAVEQTPPAPLPEMFRRFETDLSAPRQWSVSQLEVVDAELEVQRETANSAETADASKLVADLQVQGEETGTLGGVSGKDAELVGHLVHAVLERLDYAHPEEIPILLESCAYDLSADAVPAGVSSIAAGCVARFCNSPVFTDLHAAVCVHRELEFALRIPQGGDSAPEAEPIGVAGTIDCLYQRADGAWILVDYKTGRLGDLPTAFRKYGLQLGLYCLAIQQWQGRLPERVELVYLGCGAQRLMFRPTPEFCENVRERVLRAAPVLAARPAADSEEPPPEPVEPVAIMER